MLRHILLIVTYFTQWFANQHVSRLTLTFISFISHREESVLVCNNGEVHRVIWTMFWQNNTHHRTSLLPDRKLRWVKISCLDEKEYIAAYMKLACSTAYVCFNHSTSFSNDNFSSFKNSTTEARLLRNDILSVKFKYNKSSRFTNFHKTCERQARSPSHRFTGKSEQNITTIKPLSLESTRKTVWYPRAVCGAMHSGKKRRSALWLIAMHFG